MNGAAGTAGIGAGAGAAAAGNAPMMEPNRLLHLAGLSAGLSSAVSPRRTMTSCREGTTTMNCPRKPFPV